MAVFDERVPPLDAAINPDLIAFFGMTYIIDRNVVVLALEEWHGVEAFALPEHVARCGLALSLGNAPMLDPDVCAAVAMGRRDVPGREDVGAEVSRNAPTMTSRPIASSACSARR